jgi:hypothetical protein
VTGDRAAAWVARGNRVAAGSPRSFRSYVSLLDQESITSVLGRIQRTIDRRPGTRCGFLHSVWLYAKFRAAHREYIRQS